jgi:hypothetical protein
MKKSNLPIPPDLLNFEDNFFPQYTMFLISDEDQNITNFRERVEKEKEKISLDFENAKLEYNNLIEDLKIQLMGGIDEHFKVFIDKYSRFKQEVIEFKNIKLDIPQIQPPSKYDGSTGSNQQLIRELEELRYKSQISKLYQYIQEVQKDSLHKVLAISQDVLGQMSSSSHLYNSEAAQKSLKDLKNIFAQNLQLKFEPLSNFVRSIYHIEAVRETNLNTPPYNAEYLNQISPPHNN